MLVSGLPGVGKTSVVHRLASQYPAEFARVHFGALLRAAVESRVGDSMSHNAFRANFTQLLTRSDFEAATSVARMNADQASARICLLDSHAVTPTEDGLRATPDNANRLKTLRMSGLIHISSAEVTHRIVTNSQTQGRHSMTDMEAQIAEIMQVSVMVGYSAGYDCPLLLISGDGDVESVAGRLAGAARSILDAA